MNELLNRYRTQTIVVWRYCTCVIGDVLPHPDHQVLFIPLIKEQQIAGLGLIDLFTDKLAIALDQRQCRDKRLVLAIDIPPVEPQILLLRTQL